MTLPAVPLRVLTPDEEASIRLAISRGATDAEAGRAAGVSAHRFYAARKAELADIPRHKRGPRPGRPYKRREEFLDLPIDEIYRRAFEIRAARPPDMPEPLPGDRQHRRTSCEERSAMRADAVELLEQRHHRRLHAGRSREDDEDPAGR